MDDPSWFDKHATKNGFVVLFPLPGFQTIIAILQTAKPFRKSTPIFKITEDLKIVRNGMPPIKL